MNKILITLITAFLYILFSSWGFYAHKKINESAVFLLPTELAIFYKKNIKEITNKAIDADKRCYTDSLEPPRHYIDINEIDDNIDSIPVHWRKATEKYTERKLIAAGIIPWQISRTYQNLVQAFKIKDRNKIIRYSADLGHYIADSHVPLHTTSNYNGQQTNQIGIHAFWETRLPEMFAKHYNLFIGTASYVNKPLEAAWEIVRKSNTMVDSVLTLEKELSQTFRPSDIKAYIERNNQLILMYSDAYATAYHDVLNGMVERRFRSSVHAVSSYWYSAWIDAGQPKLNSLDSTNGLENEIEAKEGIKSLGRQEWH
ncbi:zinc dependent phospholipase C family protein [Sphingobacterium rhinopitheci]|uniref:zinc dependent phospholipase C family protein n=1 Tax=Sphingobacterium rhinopitheci TaxID=2781960 RepID=UPI001F524668|nr:zinc dependent phospholipase C family protein [Sphingobacterium rhinopitheci]MCI0919852.1 hypothetical protein [Sphingobacterium rhinopitheci]